jgi:MFS family permease
MLNQYFTLFKNKGFIYLWTSQILSQITIYVMNFLLLIRIFSETGSTIATSLLWVFYATPAFLVGPFASASVDMLNRKKLLMLTNLLQAAIILLYAFFSTTTIFLAFLVVLAYSFINQFYVPAELSALPSVVNRNHLPHANGLFMITRQASLIIGIAFAGLLLTNMGFRNAVFFCSALMFIAFISSSLLPKFESKKRITSKFDSVLFKFYERIIEGYRYIKNNKYVYAPFALLVFINIALVVVAVNAPILAIDFFSIDLEHTGVYMIVPAGLGALAASFFVSKIMRDGIRKILIIKTSLIAFSLTMFLIALFLPMLTHIYKLLIGLILLFVTGFSYVGILIPSQTFLQEKTSRELRGRVFGNMWYFSTVLTIIPVLLSATITELFGVGTIILILGASFLIFFIYIRNRNLPISR